MPEAPIGSVKVRAALYAARSRRCARPHAIRGLDFTPTVAEVDAGQVERVLGRPDWQAMSYVQVAGRVRALEMSANFGRRLIEYMDETGSETPGEALIALAARNGNADHNPQGSCSESS